MGITVYPQTIKTAFAVTADDPTRDAFNRFRVSDPVTLFDSNFEFDRQLFLWDEITTGDGVASYVTNSSYVRMFADNTSGAASVIRQTYEYFKYQPGKSKLILATGVMEESGGVAGVTARIGCFDNHSDKSGTGNDVGGDGVFFQLSGTTMGVGIRSYVGGSQTDTVVNQSSWNIDTMDGNGPSGITIDPSKTLIYVIDIEWLGVGSVRFGFAVDGVIHYCHQANHANLTLQVPYMRTATLPVRYEISTTGTNSGAMRQICSTVISEGGFSPSGPIYKGSRAAVTTVGTSFEPIVAIRNDVTGKKRGTLSPLALTVIGTSNDNLEWALIHNPSLTGASFADFGTNSIAEIDSSASALTGGTIIDGGFLVGSNAGGIPFASVVRSTLRARASINGTPENLVLAVRTLSGTASATGSLTWQEIY